MTTASIGSAAESAGLFGIIREVSSETDYWVTDIEPVSVSVENDDFCCFDEDGDCGCGGDGNEPEYVVEESVIITLVTGDGATTERVIDVTTTSRHFDDEVDSGAYDRQESAIDWRVVYVHSPGDATPDTGDGLADWERELVGQVPTTLTAAVRLAGVGGIVVRDAHRYEVGDGRLFRLPRVEGDHGAPLDVYFQNHWTVEHVVTPVEQDARVGTSIPLPEAQRLPVGSTVRSPSSTYTVTVDHTLRRDNTGRVLADPAADVMCEILSIGPEVAAPPVILRADQLRPGMVVTATDETKASPDSPGGASGLHLTNMLLGEQTRGRYLHWGLSGRSSGHSWQFRAEDTFIVVSDPSAPEPEIVEPPVETAETRREISVRDVEVGMFVIPGNRHSHWVALPEGARDGFTVSHVSRDGDYRGFQMNWTDADGHSCQRVEYFHSDRGPMTLVVPDPELVVPWLIAEARHRATEATRAAEQKLTDEREAFHRRLQSTRTELSAERDAARELMRAAELRATAAETEASKHAATWGPGGIVNRVACMRGDITSQCSELDRTLRGIGFYDRNGNNSAGESLFGKPEFAELAAVTRESGDPKDWYRSRWLTTVRNVRANVNGASVTLESVDVVTSAGDVDRAIEKINAVLVAGAVAKTMGLDSSNVSVADYDRRSGDTIAASGSYSLADWTD